MWHTVCPLGGVFEVSELKYTHNVLILFDYFFLIIFRRDENKDFRIIFFNEMYVKKKINTLETALLLSYLTCFVLM